MLAAACAPPPGPALPCPNQIRGLYGGRATVLLPPHHATTQWRRSVSLAASLQLLQDIHTVAEAPGRIDAALATKVRQHWLSW